MLYLLPEEQQYILKALDQLPDNWVAKSIRNKIESDIETKQNRKKCEHVFGKYIGHKECCVKCGGLDKDMGFEWQLDNRR